MLKATLWTLCKEYSSIIILVLAVTWFILRMIS